MPLNNNEAALIRMMRQEIMDLQKKISSIRIQSDLPAALPGQYPGKPVPSTEGCEITIPASSTSSQTGTIQLAADGPFIANRILFAYRPTEGSNAGRWLPLSSLDVANAISTWVNSCLDFYWSYSVTGSHRNRQNTPVPSAVLTNYAGAIGGWETFVQDTFIKASTIVITVTPTRAPSVAGVLWVGFQGCYILGE